MRWVSPNSGDDSSPTRKRVEVAPVGQNSIRGGTGYWEGFGPLGGCWRYRRQGPVRGVVVPVLLEDLTCAGEMEAEEPVGVASPCNKVRQASVELCLNEL